MTVLLPLIESEHGECPLQEPDQWRNRADGVAVSLTEASRFTFSEHAFGPDLRTHLNPPEAFTVPFAVRLTMRPYCVTTSADLGETWRVDNGIVVAASTASVQTAVSPVH